MARLSCLDVKRIEDLIKDWSGGKLTWENLVLACKNELGIETTRKTLLTRDSIKILMNLRKAELKAPSQFPRQYTDLDRANERIIRLTERVSELEKANEFMLEQFSRWAYNCHSHGINESILNQPIPKANR